MDELDELTAQAFDGYMVRKDLARSFKGRYPVPEYVAEFLLGRYCASIDETEIQEGLNIVEAQMRFRTVRAGEEELFKSRARELGSVKLIDIITARLDARSDAYMATLPSLQLNDVRISAELVSAHERMLTGGFYAELQLTYDATVAEERAGRPFGIESLRPIQLSKSGMLEDLAAGRKSVYNRAMEALVVEKRWLRTFCAQSACSGRADAADGAVCRQKLQHGRARPSGYGQVALVPANISIVAFDFWWQGHGG